MDDNTKTAAPLPPSRATTPTKPDLSALSLADLRGLQAEIAQLIAAKEKAEKAALLAEFERKAQESGFVLADLFAVTSHAPTTGGKGKKATADHAPIPPKYRNPANPQETWSGRGRQPVWVRELIAKGGTLDSTLIF